jgi:GT2 family glycosyltransferase
MKIGAVLIAHNVGPWVEQALRSIGDQNRRADCVVVVENGSTDGTQQVLEHAMVARGKAHGITLVSTHALGISGARNLGAELALRQDVDALAFLDGDDWWEPAFLEQTSRALQPHATRAGAFTWVTRRDEAGGWIGARARARRDYGYDDLCRVRSPMTTASALMIRAADFVRAGGFDARPAPLEDWEICLRLTQPGKTLGVVRRWLVNYRRRHGQVTRDAAACLNGQLFIEQLHPATRRGRHWWWLLNLAIESGDSELLARARRAAPASRPADLLTLQLARHLLLRAGLATSSRPAWRDER